MSNRANVNQIYYADRASSGQVGNLWRFACTNHQWSAIIGGPCSHFDFFCAIGDKAGPRLANRQTFLNHDKSPAASEVLTATHLTTTEKWAVQFRPGRSYYRQSARLSQWLSRKTPNHTTIHEATP